MKTILVATDFSPAALNAANYAADMAMAINAKIILLHVFHLPVNYYDAPMQLSEQELIDSAEKNIQLLNGALNIRTSASIQIETLIKKDSFYSGLADACKAVFPDVVIMGSQGTTATERFFFGGHTVYAMQHLAWPLITVPIGASFKQIKKIGLACDFNKMVGVALIDEIIAFTKVFNAELHILNIGQENDFNAELIFESAVLKEMLSSLNPVYHMVTGKYIDKEIIEFTENEQVDLLIIIPKRHALLEKLFLKSHTKQLVLHCHVPVASLHSVDV